MLWMFVWDTMYFLQQHLTVENAQNYSHYDK